MEIGNEDMWFKVVEVEAPTLEQARDEALKEARELSRHGRQKEYDEDRDGPYLWLGARWTAATRYTDENGEEKYVVIVSARGPLLPPLPPAKNREYVVDQYFKGGRPTAAAKDGMP